MDGLTPQALWTTIRRGCLIQILAVYVGASFGVLGKVLIAEEAERIADQMNRIAHSAESEEDVPHECNKPRDCIIRKGGLKIKGRHEYSVAGGRLDSTHAA